ncbi:MAG: magnesium transporter CorA family protein [Candidatus Pacebacteria bacterium]|nr:magnesium transporter CorA family protein [Candidatus Paceibacterota bacterium]
MFKILYRNLQDESIQELKDFKNGAWVHLEQPTEKEVDLLVDQFDLDPMIVADAMDIFEVPRIEMDEGITYYFTRYAIYSTDLERINTVPLLIIIGKNFLVTISSAKVPVIDLFKNGKIDFRTTQKTNLLLQILTTINTDNEKLIKKLSKQIKQQSSNLEKITNTKIAKFVNFENMLDDILFGLHPTGLALNKLLKGKFITLHEDDRELLEDLIQDNEQLIKVCNSNIKRVINTRDAYDNILSNNLNKIMKLLTSVTVILTIPTMISGIFGMNVNLPMADNPFAFIIILSVTVAASFGLLFVFLKQDWL